MGPKDIWALRPTCHLELRSKGVLVWTSKRGKAIYMEVKKQMLSKQMCVGPPLTTEHREDLD